MNSGLVGALGAAPLQTVKARLGSFQGRSHVFFPLSRDSSFVVGRQLSDSSINGGNKVGANAVSIITNRTAATQGATGDGAVAIGSGTASGTNAVSLGGGTASGSTSLAGPISVASGFYSTAFGGQPAGFSGIASGVNSFAFAGTASGDDSVCIGRNSSASATRAFVFGYRSSVTVADSYAIGVDAATAISGVIAMGNGRFSSSGDSQKTIGFRRIVTTSTTVGSMTFAVPSGKVFSILANIVAVKSDGSAVSQYIRKFCIKNVAGTTSMVGTVEIIGSDYEDNTATNIAITADDATDSLKIDVTGVTAETWRWLVTLDGSELAYGT